MGTRVERPTRPRGRPQRLPLDTTPATGEQTDGNKRLAWLLAVNRIHRSPEDARSRSGFADRLRALDVRADSSRISRWESGMDPLPSRLVRSYEMALEIPEQTLDVARRHLQRTGDLPTRSGQRADETGETTDLNQLLNAVDGGPISGAGWLALTDGLASYERVFLPDATWRALTDRLTAELTRSCGLAYARRYEAAADLMRHRASRAHVSRSVGRYTLTPGAQLVAPTLILLGEQPDPGVSDLVLRMLGSSNQRLQTAAEITAARLVAAGALDPDSPELERHVGYWIQNAPGAPRAAVAELASRMPSECFSRVVGATRSGLLRQWLHRVRDTRETVETDLARSVSDTIATATEHDDEAAAEPDPMLHTLIREALFHAHRDRRWEATVLIAASPHVAAVAGATLLQTGHEDEATARAAWGLASRLSDHCDPAQLTAAAFAETRPTLRHRALGCLGSAPPVASPDVLTRLEHTAADHSTGPAATAAGVVLGLWGHTDQMVRVAGSTPPEALQWWQQVAPMIHER